MTVHWTCDNYSDTGGFGATRGERADIQQVNGGHSRWVRRRESQRHAAAVRMSNHVCMPDVGIRQQCIHAPRQRRKADVRRVDRQSIHVNGDETISAQQQSRFKFPHTL